MKESAQRSPADKRSKLVKAQSVHNVIISYNDYSTVLSVNSYLLFLVSCICIVLSFLLSLWSLLSLRAQSSQSPAHDQSLLSPLSLRFLFPRSPQLQAAPWSPL